MTSFALIVGATTLIIGAAAALLVRRLPSLRGQLVGLAMVAVFLPIGAVLVSGLVMFDSEHDLTILAVASASAIVALAGATWLGESIRGSTDRVRMAAGALASGDLSARAPLDGPAELQSLATSINDMAAHLEQLFDSRRQLVAWASHDLRTPLANMQAMLEAIEDGLADADHYLGPLRQQVRTLSLLVDDLFELARIDAGVLTVELREARLAALIHSCLRGVEAEAAARGVMLSTRIDNPDTRARCVPEMVERVLFNLLTNALRHTPSDGSVAVVVESGADVVRVMVEDTGEGMSESGGDRPRQPEGDRPRRSGGFADRGDPGRIGAGLGLAISRGLVEAQGGRIWAENRSEGGARVAFSLPRIA